MAEVYVATVVPPWRKHQPRLHRDRWCPALLRGRGGGPGKLLRDEEWWPDWVNQRDARDCTLCTPQPR